MRKVIVLVLLLFSLTFVQSACDFDVTLLNQDPYPAVPGDYVKLVFQVEGLDAPTCSDITFDLLADYPLKFNPGETGLKVFNKLSYIKDYESNLLVPYKVRIDKDALDGTNPIEARVQNKGDAAVFETFNLEIEDSRADFEVYVTDYDYTTRELTIEVLNIEDSDIEALTIEIPKQDAISVKGSNRIVVGDLDSNEYTSADFEATLEDGDIKLNLIYSDSINVRRTIGKTIHFDSSYFTERVSDQKKSGALTYAILGAVVLLVVYIIYKRKKKAKKNKQ